MVAAVLEANIPCVSLHSLIGSGQITTMHFEHGDETSSDLFIGTDGTWSKVQPNLPTCLLNMRVSAAWICSSEISMAGFPHIAAWVGRGFHSTLEVAVGWMRGIFSIGMR